MTWDPVWEKIFREQAWGQYPPEEFIRFIAKNFYQAPNRRNIKLLEVGCGPGANLWYLAREGFSVYGIEGSQTAVERANMRLNKECPGWAGEIRSGDIRQLPFEDGFFDAVVDIEAICCNDYETAKQIYAEMARVTKKGGKLFSKTFAVGTWGDGTGKNFGRGAWLVAEGLMVGKGLTRFTSIEEICDLVSNFKISAIELKTYTVDNRKHTIREWLIYGDKL